MLGGRKVKQLYELHGEGKSIHDIASRLGISRNTVRKYLRAPELPRANPRGARGSKLDPFKGYVRQRLAEGVDNCVVLLRELRQLGYDGGKSILKDYVQGFRRQRQPDATVRFETKPGEQAQVDFGKLRYKTPDGKSDLIWVFVLVLSWSRAIYVEFIQRADVSTFIRCHINAFARLGGLPSRCLYDNAKVVVIDRDETGEPIWNAQFQDFALRMGFGTKLCKPYRPQTKGRVESGVKYVGGNFWPSARFVDLEDLNRQVHAWIETVANVRVHGTTHERPADRLLVERSQLQRLPTQDRLQTFLREKRKVGRDGYIQWDRSSYGVPWHWVGKEVEVHADRDVVEIWGELRRIAVHPKSIKPGQRLTLPGQWDGLPQGDQRRKKKAQAVKVTTVEVEQRSLAVYESVAVAGDR